MESPQCILCRESITEKSHAVQLREKGSLTINKVSKERGDSLTAHTRDLVHAACRKTYTHPTTIAKELTPRKDDEVGTNMPSLRSQMRFQFATHCLFCGQFAKSSKKKRGIDVYQVRTSDFQSSIIKVCGERGDEWASEIIGRIQSINDLHAADAIYHQTCNVNFRTKKHVPQAFCPDNKKYKTVKGRPNISNEYFLKVVTYLEENDSEQITIKDLVDKMSSMCGELAYSAVHMKRKLQEHFGEVILITDISGYPSIVTLRDTAKSILQEFYQRPKENTEDEKSQIIETAAKLLKSEIKSIANSKDFFPAASDISSKEYNLDCVPWNLQMFLKCLFSEKDSDVKISSIGQAIVQATRPRSVQQPLQIGLGVQLHHHFASKFLTDICHSLGFCSSYAEIQKFEASAAASLGTSIHGVLPGSCIQFVADNVDHNVRTLDGNNSFHGMGIIAGVTPGKFTSAPIPRLDVTPDYLKLLGKIEIRNYRQHTNAMSAMSFPKLRAIDRLDPFVRLDVVVKTVWTLRAPMPGWAGSMQMVQEGTHPGKSAVTFLPMIDMSPTDMTCIYSTLAFICRLARENERTPIVTFDQPLYWKAYSIITNESDASDLKKIVLRLGGFHLEMSFLGAIGHIMSGSGLQQILETVYAPNAVLHMLSGKAISRAVRGHMLVDTAVHSLIVSRAFETDTAKDDKIGQQDEVGNILLRTAADLYDSFTKGEISMETLLASDIIENISDVLSKEIKSLDGRRTASLWIRYTEMIQLLKSYLRAERTGKRNLHLQCVHEMLPYFAAAGHNLYAKSAYTYLAAMENLESTHPDVACLFESGYHVLRRSDRYWAGLSSDLVIEQELMRSVKTTGGLTRGRGMGEVQRAQWLLSMPACADINNAMQCCLTGMGYQTSDQHKETSIARQEMDSRDIRTIIALLQERNPFSDDPSLRNIETGETADEAVNQDIAREVGKKIIDSMSGQTIVKYSFKRAKQVVTLHTKKSVKVDEERIEVDPQVLFQRITVASNCTSDDPEELFKYELCGFPSSMFDSSGFPRQAQKPALADAIWNMGLCGAESLPHDIVSVIDGGSLLQRIPWNLGSSFTSICQTYVEYVKRNYDRPTVVFDGYLNGPSIKDVTHMRRNRGVFSRRIHFSESMPCRTKKDAFLSTPENKQAFINLLSSKLQEQGFITGHAADDADLLIVQTAVSCSRMQPVEVIGEDTDLLVLLCFHAKSDSSNIYFRSENNRTSGKEVKIWDISRTKEALGEDLCKSLFTLHALTGCDTTSRLFGIGKGPAFKKVQQSRDLMTHAAVFLSPISIGNMIVQSGERIIIALYGGTSEETLDALRYHKFASKVRTGTKSIQVNTLPPTSDAAHFHIMRAYLQCQYWIGGEQTPEPTDWGWYLKDGILLPVKSRMAPAPEHLLRIVRCSCKTNCENQRCSCRKFGLDCSAACKDCKGIGCSNSASVISDDILEEDSA